MACLTFAACGHNHSHDDEHSHAHHGHDHSHDGHDHAAPAATPKWEEGKERQTFDVLVVRGNQVQVNGETMPLQGFEGKLTEAWQKIADNDYEEVLDIQMSMGKGADVQFLNSVMDIISSQRDAQKELCAKKLFQQEYDSLSPEQQKQVKYKVVVSISQK